MILNSKEIKEAEIKLAAKLWKNRRNHRRRITNETCWRQCVRILSLFADKDIVLITYADSDLSPAAKKLFRAEEAARQIAGLDAYEDWNARPGTRVIDFAYAAKSNTLSFGGLWMILEDKPIVKSDKTAITLCREIKDIDGLTCPRREQFELKRLVEQFLPPSKFEETEVSAYDFAKAVRTGKLPTSAIKG